jgi:hypothetical protein
MYKMHMHEINGFRFCNETMDQIQLWFKTIKSTTVTRSIFAVHLEGKHLAMYFKSKWIAG